MENHETIRLKNAVSEEAFFEEKKSLAKTNVDLLQKKILRRSIAAVIVVGLGLSIVTLTLLYFDRYQLQVESLIRQTHSITFTIDVWLEKVRAIAGQISARTAVRNNLMQYIEGQKTLESYHKEAKDKLADLLVPALTQEDILSLLQFNIAGDLLLSIGLPIPEKYWQPLLLKTEDLQISAPFSLGDQTVIAVKSTIYDRTLKRVGFNVVILPLRAIEEKLKKIHRELDRDHLMISLVYWSVPDKNHALSKWVSIYHADAKNNIKNSHSWNYEQLTSELTTRNPQHLPPQLDIVMQNNHAEKFLVHTQNIPHTSWYLLLLSAERSFYLPIIEKLILTAFILIVAILLASWWLKKSIFPLSKAVIKSAFQQSEKIREQSYFVARQNQSLQETLENLKKTQNQLIENETFASVGRMVAGVSHEINTPLGVALSAMSHLNYEADILRAEFSQGPIRRSSLDQLLGLSKEYGHIVVQNLQQAINLVRSLKQVSVNQMDSDYREVSFKAYLQTILTSLTLMMKAKEINICLIGDETLKLMVFPCMMTQLMTNLVENSIKHGFKNQAQGEITVEFFCQENELHLIYRDNGAGIEAAILPKVFDAFFTTGRSQGCTGLGLHIVKSIVIQKLNGRIQAQAQEKGVIFELAWPIGELSHESVTSKIEFS